MKIPDSKSSPAHESSSHEEAANEERANETQSQDDKGSVDSVVQPDGSTDKIRSDTNRESVAQEKRHRANDAPAGKETGAEADPDDEIVELQFADEADAARQSVANEPTEEAILKSQVWTHIGFLSLAIFVITMSVVMRVPGEVRVYLPGVDEPIPGMCMSKNVTGVDCPGCGLTRSFICLGHGDIKRAWGFNPSGLALYLFVLAQIPWRIVQLVRLKLGLGELWVGKFNWLLWCIAGFMFLQWIVRLIVW